MIRPRLSHPIQIRPILATSLLLSAAPLSPAQHIGDIFIQPLAGRIDTGAYVESPSGIDFIPGLRLFRATLGDIPNSTDEPGFESAEPPAPAFPDNTTFAFDIVDALHKWNGTDFDTIPAETLRISKGTTSVLTPPLLNQLQPGFIFAQVSQGFVHEHLRYTLLSPQSAGIYLLQLRLRVTSPANTYADSLPFWIVFNQNETTEAHDAATTYLDHLLNPPCPADLNNDNAVNTADLTRLLSRFGQPTLRYANADFNGDTQVNTADLTYFLARFGTACQ